jgi:hypothetical protein
MERSTAGRMTGFLAACLREATQGLARTCSASAVPAMGREVNDGTRCRLVRHGVPAEESGAEGGALLLRTTNLPAPRLRQAGGRTLFGPRRVAAFVGITHRVGFTESSAKGTEAVLFQPEGWPELENVWRQPEPDIFEWRPCGGAPERATCEPFRVNERIMGPLCDVARSAHASVCAGFRRGSARLGAAYVHITDNRPIHLSPVRRSLARRRKPHPVAARIERKQ